MEIQEVVQNISPEDAVTLIEFLSVTDKKVSELTPADLEALGLPSDEAGEQVEEFPGPTNASAEQAFAGLGQ